MGKIKKVLKNMLTLRLSLAIIINVKGYTFNINNKVIP